MSENETNAHITSHKYESDGSYCLTEYLNSKGLQTRQTPTLICFHGSGSDHSGWRSLLEDLSGTYKTVYFDRGSRNPAPEEHNKVLWAFLAKQSLKGPYLLIAHSYGGSFAKHFAHEHHTSVMGMVLVETGKGGSFEKIQTSLIKKGRLESQPLVVIQANSFLRQQESLQADLDGSTGAARSRLQAKIDWLRKCIDEDERLEKDQLRLSRNSKLVYLPDCGHNVVSERPEIVVQEVQWIIDQSDSRTNNVSWLARMQKLLPGTRAVRGKS